MPTNNPAWKRLEGLLDKASAITNSDAVPCFSAGLETWTCFRAYRAARINEKAMCPACALHWTVIRAQTLLEQMRRAAR